MKDDSKILYAVRAALGLATAYFPVDSPAPGCDLVRADHVGFVLDGHLEAWDRWRVLPSAERLRFGRLMRMRHNRLADAKVARKVLDELLEAGELPGCRRADDYETSGLLLVELGMAPLRFTDDCLAVLDDLERKRSRCLPVAEPGGHRSILRVPREGGHDEIVDARYEIRQHHLPDASHPAVVTTAADRERIEVPLDELEDIAVTLDERFGTEHRTKSVRRFIDKIRGRPGTFDETGTKLVLEAGELNELIAYTGFGKSVVLIESFACWAVENEVVVTYVLPNNAEVAKYAHTIETAFTAIRPGRTVTPLISPRSMMDVARMVTGPPAEWVWRQFGYGCALAAAASTDEAVDTWTPGKEPCTSLQQPRKRGDGDRTVACPFRTTCGRYRLVRAALSADVIVTSHANLHLGVLQFPVDDGLGVTDRMSVEELVMRRSHVVVIDEVDEFQRGTISQAGRGLVLDEAGNIDTQLRRLDNEFGAAFGRVRAQVDASVRDSYHAIRYLSENYVSHLAYGRIGEPAPGVQRRWTVPRRWDAWLTARLFGMTDEDIAPEQVVVFQSLFPGRDCHPHAGEPGFFPAMRPLLELLTTAGSGAGTVASVRAELDRLLGPRPADEGEESDEKTAEERAVVPGSEERAKVVDRLVRRAILERIRVYLHRLMNNSPQLVDAGIESVQVIADALGTYGRWRFTPTGPLGRLVFAFTEHVDADNSDDAWLRAAAFGGDPHVSVAQLGDTTALAHAGTPRVVLGLSATAFFPLAPHHHVHVEPRWWVRDDTDSVEVVPAEAGDAIRISGLSGAERDAATRKLAMHLWKEHLRKELAHLKKTDKDRARVLLATTSYASGQLIAEGLVAAGVEAPRICLATRPDKSERTPAEVHAHEDGWRELPADKLDEMTRYACDILIAPLARVQRGVNIIGAGDRSALGSVWLLVRPIPLIDEPEELVAHIQSTALRKVPGNAADPLDVLERRRTEAGTYFDEIVRSKPYFSSQPRPAQLGVVAEILNGAIQLVGRARRGETEARLHLVDGAFLNPSRGPNFAALVQELRQEWRTTGVLARMESLYGTTLQAFFDYADKNATTPEKPC